MGVQREDSPPARFSELKPPHVFRPVEASASAAELQALMTRLHREEIVRKMPERLRLDTLFARETRLVSYLGQTAINHYIDALELLGPKAGWDEPVTVGVSALTANHRKGGTGNRVIMQLEPNDQLDKERAWALEITKRMTGEEPPHLFFKRDITIAMLNGQFDKNRLQERLDAVRPESIALLPTVIEYQPHKRGRPERRH